MQLFKMITLAILTFFSITPSSAKTEKQITIISFAKLIDGTGKVLEGHEIAVSNGKIKAIGDDLLSRYPAAIGIDKSDSVALPGLIDAHVHITYALDGQSKGDAWSELFQTSFETRLEGGRQNAMSTLKAGVTSARDLFSIGGVSYALKTEIDEGKTVGPRLFLSGAGIHPITVKPLKDGEDRDIVEEFSAITKARIDEGATWIKIFATMGTADDLSSQQIFNYPEIKAVVDMAHKAGIRVAIHSYGPSAVPDALRAGVDSIEHPVDLNDDLLRVWSKTDTIYVPTIDHNRYYGEYRQEYGYDAATEENLKVFINDNVIALRRAHEAGIRIAMGSDAVMTMFGQNAYELEWFIQAGLSHAEAIQTATINGAILLGVENALGRLAPGFKADIIAVNGDPLTDIKALTRNVVWVMKAGEVVVSNDLH